MRTAVIFLAFVFGVEIALGMTLFKRHPPKGGPPKGCHPPPFVIPCHHVFQESGVSDPCAETVEDPINGGSVNVGEEVNAHIDQVFAATDVNDAVFQNAATDMQEVMNYGEGLFGDFVPPESADDADWSILSSEQQNFITGMCDFHVCGVKTVMQKMKAGGEPPQYCANVEKPSLEEMEAKMEEMEEGEMRPTAEGLARHTCFAFRHAKMCPKMKENMMGRSLPVKTGAFKRVLNNLTFRQREKPDDMPDFENMTEEEIAEFLDSKMDDFKAKKEAKMNKQTGNAREALKRALKRLLA